MRRFLRNTRRGWMVFNSPDSGGGSGGGGSESESVPALTIEQQLEKALIDAHSSQQLAEKRAAELKSVQDVQEQVDKLTSQFDEATKEGAAAKADVTRLTGELASATSERDTARVDRDNANKNVERLEILCGLKGIDPKAAVTVPVAGSPAGQSPTVQQYLDLKAKEDKGEVAHGTASKFYRKHKAEIEAESA